MDTFSAIVLVGIVVVVGTFLLLGKLSTRRSVQDITDKGDRERWGEQAAIEERDVGQMVESQNEYRRRRGAPEQTEAEVRRRVGEEEIARLDQAEREDRG
ncbi:MAG TPA: hypothetical protein VGW10_01360 [Solirubrobacteraceae bacterium]|nr:hypothetical protein [Solirubrobacteraceae bacterium]